MFDYKQRMMTPEYASNYERIFKKKKEEPQYSLVSVLHDGVVWIKAIDGNGRQVGTLFVDTREAQEFLNTMNRLENE